MDGGQFRPLSYIWVDVASRFGAIVWPGGKPFTLSGYSERSNRMSRLDDSTACNRLGVMPGGYFVQEARIWTVKRKKKNRRETCWSSGSALDGRGHTDRA